MPGMDYLAYKDMDEDNLFYDPVKMIGFDVASVFGAKYMKKRGQRYLNRAKPVGEFSRLGPGGSTPFGAGVNTEPSYRASDSMAQTPGGRRVLRARGRANIGYAKTLRGLGRTFGIIGMAQVGFLMARGLADVGSSMRVDRESTEMMRYDVNMQENTYFDSRAAFTQRQRALQVIHNSRLALKPALGGEASYLHA